MTEVPSSLDTYREGREGERRQRPPWSLSAQRAPAAPSPTTPQCQERDGRTESAGIPLSPLLRASRTQNRGKKHFLGAFAAGSDPNMWQDSTG